MCGRFSQEAELSEIKIELKIEQLELFREFRPIYNIAPSYGPGNEQLFVVKTLEGKKEAEGVEKLVKELLEKK